MTEEEFGAVFGVLEAAWPAARIKPATVATYRLFLLDLPAEALGRAAARAILDGGEWFPSISRLRRLAAGDSPEDGGMAGHEAWAEVLAAVGRVGYCGEPEWSDPRIGDAVRVLGPWRAWCATAQVSERTANRARFLEAWEVACARSRRARADDVGRMIAAGGVRALRIEPGRAAGEARS